MARLKEVRKQLAETLQSYGIKTTTLFNTKNIKPPVNFITPTDNYISFAPQTRMNAWNIQLSIVVVSGGSGEASIDEVDDLIEKTIMAIADPQGAEWTVDACSGPQKIKFEGQSNEYYAGVVIVSTLTPLDNI